MTNAYWRRICLLWKAGDTNHTCLQDRKATRISVSEHGKRTCSHHFHTTVRYLSAKLSFWTFLVGLASSLRAYHRFFIIIILFLLLDVPNFYLPTQNMLTFYPAFQNIYKKHWSININNSTNMDLTHLFKFPRDIIQTRSRTLQDLEDSAGSDREMMFKRKGFNFYSSTSDSRIIRSSKVLHFSSKDVPRVFTSTNG